MLSSKQHNWERDPMTGLLMSFVLGLGVRVWREFRWTDAGSVERIAVLAVFLVMGIIVFLFTNYTWGTLGLLGLSALGGWLAPEIFWGILETTREAAVHGSRYALRYLGPLLPIVVFVVGLAIFANNDPMFLDQLAKLAEPLIQFAEQAAKRLLVVVLMLLGAALIYRHVFPKKKKS